MKISTTLTLLALLIIVIGWFVMFSDGGTARAAGTTGAVIAGAAGAASDDVQRVTLGFANGNYAPNTLRVKAEKPVELTFDGSTFGCFRGFTVRALGIAAYSKNPGDVIRFTPTKKGTFAFTCSMGMGSGKLIVE